MTKDQEVATEILNQMGGRGRLVAMIGAKHIFAIENGLSFKFGGSRKFNYCAVRLNALDLYNVEIGKIKKFDYEPLSVVENISFDMLQTHFSDVTKLDLSL